MELDGRLVRWEEWTKKKCEMKEKSPTHSLSVQKYNKLQNE